MAAIVIDDIWRPMDEAPKDGSWIQADICGHAGDNIIAWKTGLVGNDGNECGGWYFVTEQEPPGCWTHGVCWVVNEDGVASIPPTHWKPFADRGK